MTTPTLSIDAQTLLAQVTQSAEYGDAYPLEGQAFAHPAAVAELVAAKLVVDYGIELELRNLDEDDEEDDE